MSRHYSYLIGRFHQPDKINGKQDSPLSWNLYSYVQGNPMNLTDPLGLHKKDLGSGTWDATIPYQKPIDEPECRAQGCNLNDKNKACYCTDENGKERKVETVEEAKELNEKKEKKDLLRAYAKWKDKGYNFHSIHEFESFIKGYKSFLESKNIKVNSYPMPFDLDIEKHTLNYKIGKTIIEAAYPVATAGLGLTVTGNPEIGIPLISVADIMKLFGILIIVP